MHCRRTQHRILEFDVHENPVPTLDANGTELRLEYHADGRLIERTVLQVGAGVAPTFERETWPASDVDPP